MATSTFERKIEITDVKAVEKLLSMMAENVPSEPLSQNPYTEQERERSVSLLKQCLSRSRT